MQRKLEQGVERSGTRWYIEKPMRCRISSTLPPERTRPPIMKRILQSVIMLLGIGVVVGTVQAQQVQNNGNGNNGNSLSCPNGTVLIAKFQNEGGNLLFEKPDGNESVVTIESIDTDNEGEIVGGTWSSKTRIGAVIVKGGPGSSVNGFNTLVGEGEFSNDELDGKGISHIKYCAPIEESCDNPTLQGDDDVNQEARTVSNTMRDQEGIGEFVFTTLENFTVSSITPSSNFERGGPDNRTWTWTGDDAPPTDVAFTLQAGSEGSATYFLKATDGCTSPKTTDFDPRFDLGPANLQFRFQGSAPNPLTTHTTIEFVLSERTEVTLSVYNVMGQKVATLVDGNRSPGEHTVGWSGRSDRGQPLASGVYVMRLQAGQWVDTQRLTIVR